ncbi:unnamed protein product [Parajaminaea phylloscopi]
MSVVDSLTPPGFSAIRAPAASILLPLTISNKCGQSFRWRSRNVWEPARRNAGGGPYVDQKGARVKTEPKEETALPLTGTTHHSNLESWTEWSICLSDRVVLLRQDEDNGYIFHRTLLPKTGEIDWEQVNDETRAWVVDYLNLTVPLEALYDQWAEADKVFARFATKFRGIRMLRQDPWECVCSFICSSNNNIARIGQMVQNLCSHYSPKLLTHTFDTQEWPPGQSEPAYPSTAAASIDYYPFPAPSTLARPGVEAELRALGFGYRAKYLHESAKLLCETHGLPEAKAEHFGASSPGLCDHINATADGTKEAIATNIPAQSRGPLNTVVAIKKEDPDGIATEAQEAAETHSASYVDRSVHAHLASIRRLDYHTAREELLKLQGVGPKVADCILLMSMDQPSSIPVDRHVFQFAARWYGLRNAKYEDLATYFRQRWGEYAGWAHSVLFTADLRAFKDYQGDVKKEEAAVKPEEEPSGLLVEPQTAVLKQEIDSVRHVGSRSTSIQEQIVEVKPARRKRANKVEEEASQPVKATRRSTRVTLSTLHSDK